MLRKEGVVTCVEQQRRHADPLEVKTAGGSAPVVVRVAEAVQRRRHEVVELAERAGLADLFGVVEARKEVQLGERLRPERGQEMRSEEHTSELQSPCNLVCR